MKAARSRQEARHDAKMVMTTSWHVLNASGIEAEATLLPVDRVAMVTAPLPHESAIPVFSCCSRHGAGEKREKPFSPPLNALPDVATPFRGGAPMESLRVERLDHFGLIACAIKDLGLMEMLDSRL